MAQTREERLAKKREQSKRWRAEHREEHNADNRARYARDIEASRAKCRAKNNTPKARAYRRAWQLENAERYKDRQRAWRRKKNSGIDEARFAELLREQRGLCAICQQPLGPQNNTCADHDHSTGKVRGLLCRKCNWGIGQFDDDVVKLSAAIEYLKAHGRLHYATESRERDQSRDVRRAVG